MCIKCSEFWYKDSFVTENYWVEASHLRTKRHHQKRQYCVFHSEKDDFYV